MRGVTQERVSEAIRVLMARRREHQQDLAEVLGVTQSSVSLRLAGRVVWTVDELDALSDHYGVSVVALVRGFEEASEDLPER